MAAVEGASEAYVFQGNNLVFPDNREDAKALNPLSRDLIFDVFGGPEKWLFSGYYEIPRIDGKGPVAGFMLENDAPLPVGWRSAPLRQTLSAVVRGVVSGDSPEGILFRVYHIMQWRRESAYCGSCGSLNGDSATELARRCPVCGRLEFPRISPAVIVLVTNDRNEALLAHNANFINGVYSLIAGFVEAGENLESTIVREIKEEVNIEVDRVRYVASQPWPFPNSLMLGFTARYAGGELKPDGKEILDAKWFTREQLPNLPGNGSIARFIINQWLEPLG
ncbi:NAD(+) diphosphatase [Treponema primitia]|uniref:NAD(+) diphosphatase n=1 Tax=Treponema primitia TaxID=88058 RepID=UPI0039802DAA